MALLTALALRARSRDSLLSVPVRRLIAFPTLLDLAVEGSRAPRHVKPPHYGEASSKSRSLSKPSVHYLTDLPTELPERPC